MKTTLVTGALLLAVVAAFTANAPGEPQASAAKNSGTVSQDAAKQSSTVSRSASEPATADKRKIPCKTPQNAAQCYWTHGRLSYYSANFTWLLWKVGTHRLLKICDEPTYLSMQGTGDCADPEFPANLERIYNADRRRWKRAGGHGDYFPPDVSAILKFVPLSLREKARGNTPASNPPRSPLCRNEILTHFCRATISFLRIPSGMC